MLNEEIRERITEGLFQKPSSDACWNCSEYVAITVGSLFNIPKHDLDILQKTATAFGFGMGDSHGPCGLLTGLIMLLGYQKGRSDASDKASKSLCYDLGKELKEEIIARQDLIPDDLRDAGGFWSHPDPQMACRQIKIPAENGSETIEPERYCRAFLRMALDGYHQIWNRLT